MNNEEIKAEIVKALKMGMTQYNEIFTHLFFNADVFEFNKALNELIKSDRVTETDEGYYYLNY